MKHDNHTTGNIETAKETNKPISENQTSTPESSTQRQYLQLQPTFNNPHKSPLQQHLILLTQSFNLQPQLKLIIKQQSQPILNKPHKLKIPLYHIDKN